MRRVETTERSTDDQAAVNIQVCKRREETKKNKQCQLGNRNINIIKKKKNPTFSKYYKLPVLPSELFNAGGEGGREGKLFLSVPKVDTIIAKFCGEKFKKLKGIYNLTIILVP